MYVFSNTVRAEDGSIIGRFADHHAACIAMVREANPAYAPLYFTDTPEHLAEQHAMMKRIQELRVSGVEV